MISIDNFQPIIDNYNMLLGVVTIIIMTFVILALITSFVVATFGGGPFVPTKMKAVHKVLKYAEIKKGDKLYDIGAGDGRFIHFATKNYGANSVGFEIDPFVYALAKFRQIFFRWKGKMIRGNFTKYNISDADIVVCYMLPRTLKKFQKKFDRELKKGTKVISYAFSVGNWKPKKTIQKGKGISKIMIYEVN